MEKAEVKVCFRFRGYEISMCMQVGSTESVKRKWGGTLMAESEYPQSKQQQEKQRRKRRRTSEGAKRPNKAIREVCCVVCQAHKHTCALHTYTYTYTHTHVHISYICIHIHTHKCAFHTCIHITNHKCISKYPYVYAHTWLHAYIRICLHVHFIHTYNICVHPYFRHTHRYYTRTHAYMYGYIHNYIDTCLIHPLRVNSKKQPDKYSNTITWNEHSQIVTFVNLLFIVSTLGMTKPIQRTNPSFLHNKQKS